MLRIKVDQENWKDAAAILRRIAAYIDEETEKADDEQHNSLNWERMHEFFFEGRKTAQMELYAPKSIETKWNK